jgi:hypothetical protein
VKSQLSSETSRIGIKQLSRSKPFSHRREVRPEPRERLKPRLIPPRKAVKASTSSSLFCSYDRHVPEGELLGFVRTFNIYLSRT